VVRGLRSLPCAAAALIALAAGALALPAIASATLVYVRKPAHPVVYIAENNGSGAKRLVSGDAPRISPDGTSVVYLRISNRGREYTTEMMVVPAAGGTPRKLSANWREPYVFAFSPDSSTIATVVGPEVGKQELVLIELASGTTRKVAKGYFSGVSFSPSGSQIVYGMAPSEHYPAKTNLYRANVSGGAPVALTHDDVSESPVWGPGEQIAFAKLLEAGKRQYGPKSEIYLMNPEGGEVRRLTHTKVAPLLQGLLPTQWSASGSQLLCEFGGEDTSYAVTVNPKTGAEHRPTSGLAGYGFTGAAISSDGTTVLGTTGGFEPSPKHDVATVPYGGGKPTILVRDAFEPSWNR
jgi:dipeptidyl aminopeptidase/acylaminoacyl peptidase